MARSSAARAQSGRRTWPVASSAARSRAAPRRRSPGGRTSSTSIPAAIRCSPGSRSSPTSPTRNGSGRRQTQPRRGRPELTDLHRYGRGPDVQHQLAVQGVRRTQADVDLRGVQPRARRPNGVPAADVVPVHAPQVQRNAGHRADSALVAAQRLQPADGDAPPGMFQLVAHPDRAGRQRAGHDRARTPDGEGAVDPKPHVGGGVRSR